MCLFRDEVEVKERAAIRVASTVGDSENAATSSSNDSNELRVLAACESALDNIALRRTDS